MTNWPRGESSFPSNCCLFVLSSSSPKLLPNASNSISWLLLIPSLGQKGDANGKTWRNKRRRLAAVSGNLCPSCSSSPRAPFSKTRCLFAASSPPPRRPELRPSSSLTTAGRRPSGPEVVQQQSLFVVPQLLLESHPFGPHVFPFAHVRPDVPGGPKQLAAPLLARWRRSPLCPSRRPPTGPNDPKEEPEEAPIERAPCGLGAMGGPSAWATQRAGRTAHSLPPSIHYTHLGATLAPPVGRAWGPLLAPHQTDCLPAARWPKSIG